MSTATRIHTPNVDLNEIRNNRTFKEVSVSRLVRCRYNPLKRREKYDDIQEDIKVNGQLEPIHVVVMNDGSLEVADGNRRTAAMKDLGVAKAQAFVYDGGQPVLDALFDSLNHSKMTLKNDQMVQAHLMGGPLFNKTVESTVNYLRKIFSPFELVEVSKGKFGYGSTAISTAKRIVDYTTDLVRGTDEFDNRVKAVLLWMVRKEQQQYAIAYMRNEYSPRILANAIDKNASTPKMTVQ